MSDNQKTPLINKYKSALLDYTKCMQPQLEYIRDRLNFNRAYVESDLEAFCQNERNAVKGSIEDLDKILEKN